MKSSSNSSLTLIDDEMIIEAFLEESKEKAA
jgi:hypothetical protein